MAREREIKSEKILVKDIFTTMWFRIPEYQRPYIWSKDEVNELLDDLMHAQRQKADHDYFLGSFVFQSKRVKGEHGQDFLENDLLDGQQRMTTLLMLFACIRDLSQDDEIKLSCQNSLFQKGDKIDGIPERTRIVFAIRPEVQDFVDDYIKADRGTERISELESLAAKSDDRSIPNMARAILEMRRYLQSGEKQIPLENFVRFLRTRVLLIYVSTQDLDDAFRLFTILNDRGVPLRGSDILKSLNLGALVSENDRVRYAELWEQAEGELGDDFDRFLNHLRTILVKEKARLSLLQEFEEKIYDPKERDKASGNNKPALLKKGKDTFQLVERYLKHYRVLLGGNNYDVMGRSFRFDNLVRFMLTGLPSTDWIPPLLSYFDKFGPNCMLEFLTLLDNKFSADWISQCSPSDRIESMIQVIKAVEESVHPESVIGHQCFELDSDGFNRAIEGLAYGRRFTRYLLIKLDYLYQDHAHRIALESLSVEHVLPRNPAEASQWKRDFTEEQRAEWTDRLGNLVLISSAKNSSQGRSDYLEKKARYFSNRISTCPNSLRVLQNDRWTPLELEANHDEVLHKIRQHYRIK